MFVDNQAGQSGSAPAGAIYTADSNPELNGKLVCVSGSYITPTGLGRGIYAHRSSATLRYNTISGNLVDAQLNSCARGGGALLLLRHTCFGVNPSLS
jgi:hypothetical protein